MGKRISIDSASMFNKALELIEAKYFNLSANQIEVIIHPESIIHSMVTFIDNSTLAQLCPNDRTCNCIYFKLSRKKKYSY